MPTTGAEAAIAHFEGLTKETSTCLDYHKKYFAAESTQRWNWSYAPGGLMTATGPETVVAVHTQWWTTFPDLNVSRNVRS